MITMLNKDADTFVLVHSDGEYMVDYSGAVIEIEDGSEEESISTLSTLGSEDDLMNELMVEVEGTLFIEDDVLVTRDGHLVLSDLPKQLDQCVVEFC